MQKSRYRRDGYTRTTGVKLDNSREFELSASDTGEFEQVDMLPNHLTEAQFHLLDDYNPKEVARWMIPIQ